ncbi:MAG: hypothetical protein K8S98_00240 [Planctomycetes bacterium]|nr:hypothetical protein [Planctomycetota bacterium]
MVWSIESAVQRAIKHQHGLDGTYRECVHVVETVPGNNAWRGDVYVFDVTSPNASCCYAWTARGTDTIHDEVVAALGKLTGDSPAAAVRAWIVSKAKSPDV